MLSIEFENLEIDLKKALLVAGCFLLQGAVIPMIMWGVTAGLANFYPVEATKLNLPTMTQLMTYSVIYSVELAAGLLLIKKGLS